MRAVNLIILFVCATLLLFSILRWFAADINLKSVSPPDAMVAPPNEMTNDTRGEQYLPDSLSSDPKFLFFLEEMTDKLERYNIEAEKNGKWYRWLNISVTILTAGSTCVSAIHASRKEQAESRSRIYLTLCAVLTLISSVTNTVASSFSEDKSESTKQATYWTNKRSQFITDYQTAKIEDKTKVIERYGWELL